MDNQPYLRAVAERGGSLLSYIGLLDDRGRELRIAPYHRQEASWIVQTDGRLDLAENLVFQVPGGSVVAAWRGYSSTRDEDGYLGASVPVERFNGAGEYTLLAQGTSVYHQVQRPD